MFKPTAMFAIPSKPSDDLSEILPRLFAAILSDGPLKGCDCPKCAAQTKTDDNDDTDSHDVTPVDDASQPKRSDMHFGQAMIILQIKLPARRRSWSSEQFVLLSSDRKTFLRENGSVYRLSAEDVFAQDWEPAT